MKTKNVKVKLKDLKKGKKVYIASPFFGIEEHTITSKPYKKKFLSGDSAFKVDTYNHLGLIDCMYLSDSGVFLDGRKLKCRRTFSKKKHALEWMRKMKTDKNLCEAYERHQRMSFDNRFIDIFYS